MMPFETAEDTLLCINNLAGVLRSMNAIDDAEECYKELERNRVNRNGVFNEAESRPWGRSMVSKGSTGRGCSKIVSSSQFHLALPVARMSKRPSYNVDLGAGVS